MYLVRCNIVDAICFLRQLRCRSQIETLNDVLIFNVPFAVRMFGLWIYLPVILSLNPRAVQNYVAKD